MPARQSGVRAISVSFWRWFQIGFDGPAHRAAAAVAAQAVFHQGCLTLPLAIAPLDDAIARAPGPWQGPPGEDHQAPARKTKAGRVVATHDVSPGGFSRVSSSWASAMASHCGHSWRKNCRTVS